MEASQLVTPVVVAAKATWKVTKKSYKAFVAWKNRPPSLAQTTKAQNELRVARAFVDDYTEWYKRNRELAPYQKIDKIEPALAAIKRARWNDKTAIITVEHDGRDVRHDADSIAAEAYFYMYAAEMDCVAKFVANDMPRNAIEEHLNPAYKYIKLARQFEPQDVQYIAEQAHCEGKLRYKWRARKTIKEALALNPNDIHALKIQAEL